MLYLRIRFSNEQKEENYKEDPTILESGDFDLEKITRISTFYNQQKVYLEANEFLYRKVAGLYLQVFPLSEIAMSGLVFKEWEEENKKWGSGIFKIGVIGRFSEERKNGFILLNSLVKDHLIDILIDKSKIQLIDKKLNEALGLLI